MQVSFRAGDPRVWSDARNDTFHSSDVSRLETTTSMVLRSQVRGDRSSAAIPNVEVRPEIEFRQEPEIDNPAEIEVSVSTSVKGIWAPEDQLPLKNRRK